MRKMFIGVVLLSATLSVVAQTSSATPQQNVEILTPTELEQFKIESALKDLVIMQLQFQQKQTEMQSIQNGFAAQQTVVDKQVESIKVSHNWGTDVTFNKQTAKFNRIPTQHPPVKPAVTGMLPKDTAPTKK